MRGEDRSSVLAVLDQQAFLRQVLRAIRSTAISATDLSGDRFAGRRSFDRTRDQTQTNTTGDRAARYHTGGAEFIEHKRASYS